MSDLKTISRLAQLQLELEAQCEELREELKNKEAQLRKVSESDLPEAMDEAEMSEFKLQDGRKVTIEEAYHASLPKDPDKRNTAFTFLRENERGAVIKRVISVVFGAGEDRAARNFLRRIQRSKTLADNEVKDDENVHPSTLKAVLREMKEDGYETPDEAFGLYVRRYAKIK